MEALNFSHANSIFSLVRDFPEKRFFFSPKAIRDRVCCVRVLRIMSSLFRWNICTDAADMICCAPTGKATQGGGWGGWWRWTGFTQICIINAESYGVMILATILPSVVKLKPRFED